MINPLNLATPEMNEYYAKVFKTDPVDEMLKADIFREFRDHNIFTVIHRKDNVYTEDKLTQPNVYLYDIIFDTVFGLQNITNFDAEHKRKMWGDIFDEIQPTLYHNTYEEAEDACIMKVFEILTNIKYIKKNGIRFAKEFTKHLVIVNDYKPLIVRNPPKFNIGDLVKCNQFESCSPYVIDFRTYSFDLNEWYYEDGEGNCYSYGESELELATPENCEDLRDDE